MASSNVEIKARDRDPEATRARCEAIGAGDHGTLHQRDTYFGARHGRLKLREQRPGLSELIAYRRPDTPAAEVSEYTRAPVPDPQPLREALDRTLGTTLVVTKRRRLLLWHDVRIHLDAVEGLGTFLELEALVGAGGRDAAHARIAHLRAQLAIEDAALIAVGYADLLGDGVQTLLRAAQAAMENAYAPYSRFRVGAAVRATSGAVYAGANVENVALPQGQCAEASAVGALVTAGETALTEVAVVADRREVCPPCGGCRQRLAEFGTAATPVHLGRPGREPHTVTLGELLPESFTRATLDA
jgi:homotetrameric cytidine deaminase